MPSGLTLLTSPGGASGTLQYNNAGSFGGAELRRVSATVYDFGATPITGAFGIPVGTTAERPGSPITGYLRLNSTTGLPEIWTGAAWDSIEVGTGDVVGPAGATDNALARYNGATGLLIQDSPSTLDDSGNLALGTPASATPASLSFTLGGPSRPGTDVDVGGGSGTFRSGLGTGAGAASSLVFQTPTLVASGSTTQTYATRLTVATAAVTATVPLLFSADNTLDIGATGATRPRTGYFGTNVVAGSNFVLGALATPSALIGTSYAGVRVGSDLGFSWSSTTDALAAADLFLRRVAAANLGLGAAAANDAAGVAQTITAPDGGTSTGVGRAGADLTLVAGDGSVAAGGSGLAGGAGGALILSYGTGAAGDGAGATGAEGFIGIRDANCRLYQDAPDTLALRRGAVAQILNVYGTFTDATNYVRLALSANATTVFVAAETAGTGADNVNVALAPVGTGVVQFNNPTDGSAASAGTLLNAPSAGNPTYWLKVNVAGVGDRFIPCWT